MTKDQKQVAMLSAMLAVIVGVLGYSFRDSLLPKGSGGAGNIPAVRLSIPSVDDRDPFFEREDYRALRGAAGVPVQPLKIETKGVNPFVKPN